MKKKITVLISVVVCVLTLLSSCAVSDAENEPSSESGTSAKSASKIAAPDMSSATQIEFSDSKVTSTSDSVNCSGANAVITGGGVYVITGSSSDGSVTVNAPDSEVWLVMKNADITRKDSSPVYVYKSKKTYIWLDEGSENKLSDLSDYSYTDEFTSKTDEEPNACVYSKSDLVIYGSGTLEVDANFNNGITSKDNLEIYDCVLNVKSANNGINGKDSLVAQNTNITVNSGADAIRSTNDTDSQKGYITLNNCNLTLTAGEDGIQAETSLNINAGTYNITSGGGHSATLADSQSAKGLKGGALVSIADGTFNLDCADDGVHSNSSVTVSGGEFNINTGDDAFHADGTLTISGGKINVESSYEGLEGSDVEVSGGEFSIISSDDGLNAAGGKDESGFGNKDSWQSGGNHSIKISGGTFNITAGGDGIDSNGNIEISGGNIAVSSSTDDNGALDYDGACTLTGGTLFAESKSSVMAQAPSDCEQATVFVSFGTAADKGSSVTISGGGKTFTYTLTCEAANFVFSSPELTTGETYTVSLNGNEVCEITLDDMLTAYGNVNASGMPGGQPGQGGGNMMSPGQNSGGMQKPDGNMGAGM